MEVSEGVEKRPNFSALGQNNSISKTPSTTSKPGDIRKLIIKNFKGIGFVDKSDSIERLKA